MNIKDLLTFAKAGWKPAEVKELLEAVQNTQDPEPEPEPEPEPKEPEPEETDPEPEPEPDYKKLYEQEKAEKEALQEKNTRKEQPEEPSDQDKINDIVRAFM